MRKSMLVAASVCLLAGVASAAPVLNAATLPNSRAVAVGAPATTFASVINSGDEVATNCRVALGFGADPNLAVSYAPADGGGVINGPVDTPVAIGIGATQQFVVAVTAATPFSGSVPLAYVCDNGQAISATGLNDLALRATTAAGPDIITIASTLSGDGIMATNVNGRALIAISAVNFGTATAQAGDISAPNANEADISVSMSFTNFTDGAQHSLTICQTNAVAVCQTPFAESIQLQIGDAPVTFNVALQQLANIGVPFFPGEYRLRVEFRDSNGNLVGATSVAPRSDTPAHQESLPHGYWDLFVRDDSDPGGRFTRVGRLFFPPDGGVPTGGIVRDGPGGQYIQPVVLQGDYNADRFIGCMRFLDTGNNDAAHPGVNIRFEPRHFLRGTYDSNSLDSCPPQAGAGVDAPMIDPGGSSGVFFGGYVGLAEDDGMDPPLVNWTITNPIDESDNYGTATMTLVDGQFQFSGTYRDCDLTGTGMRYGSISDTFGTQLAFQVSYTTSNCPPGAPSWATGDFTGFFVVGADDDDSNDVEALQGIFTDGFESGDVSAWSATIP
ncbi:hypothetical protein [Hyphobacterium sp.]|uniref:hypothetical protein n=1 Tax=Hyphobacterium sp. TaxID=2004662 RepID=UPI003BA84533